MWYAPEPADIIWENLSNRYLDIKDNNLKELFLYHINSAAVHGRQLLKSKHCFGSAFVVSGINILYV